MKKYQLFTFTLFLIVLVLISGCKKEDKSKLEELKKATQLCADPPPNFGAPCGNSGTIQCDGSCGEVTQLPLEPTDLTISFITPLIIDDQEMKFVGLKWKHIKRSFEEINFSIYRSENDGTFVLKAKTDNHFFNETVDLDKKYGYYVTAVSEFGESKPSNTVFVLPGQSQPPTEQLQPPFNLKADAKIDENGQPVSILTWNSAGGDSFNIYRNKDGSPFEKIASTKVKTYNDNEVGKLGKGRYDYYVTAVLIKPNIESAPSPAITFANGIDCVPNTGQKCGSDGIVQCDGSCSKP